MLGDYTVRITRPLTLAANGKVRILPNPGQTDGILVEPANPGDPGIDGGIPGTNNCLSDNKLIKTPGNPPPLIIALPAPLPACD
jgi:hypothetical protein